MVAESRSMLHSVFDQLEAHGDEIGSEIMEQTAEEMTLGPCPVCGRDLRIRHLRNQTQFIGCTGYPECTFNIGLPMAMWGRALRTDKQCPVHGLHHVKLVRKGSRPWEIGCPLCHHIESNKEAFSLMPSLTPAHRETLLSQHIYTVSEMANTAPERLAEILDIPGDKARALVREAEVVLTLLRRRSDCRKLVRRMLAPKKGRSPAKIIRSLQESGINDVAGLAGADPALLKKLGITEKEADSLLGEAKMVESERFLRNAGIPAASMKKYFAAGIFSPEDFLSGHPVWLSGVSGLSLDTVQRHVEMVAQAKGVPPPVKYTRTQVSRGKEELSSIPGLTEPLLGQLQKAGIINGTSLLAADAATIAARTGIPEGKIKVWQAVLREREKKPRDDIIVI